MVLCAKDACAKRINKTRCYCRTIITRSLYFLHCNVSTDSRALNFTHDVLLRQLALLRLYFRRRKINHDTSIIRGGRGGEGRHDARTTPSCTPGRRRYCLESCRGVSYEIFYSIRAQNCSPRSLRSTRSRRSDLLK